ncbi:hypothetical protein GLW04_10705 [Halobacillus litoralis]|uniref:Uncharacterized protein n=1 Tax=Halobacillus litoralis TaxID=45668 RepID=A0A845DS86_9BACI|nr:MULTISPECIES: hypothetical protein [Halobacillus]MCA1020804.1 hypothetical protein [Halobacillus litoralis]MYL20360.1 hypothetical protein [Halobacillus litoralis]MYL29454.1 hypothetical protein [Halobacillus halophilus]MYL36671.1 hypothetical protein [Halobacillus litoralis]
MFAKSKTTPGKWLVYLGLWIFAAGFAFSEIVGLDDTPYLLEAASIPLMVIGLLMLLSSNFFTKKRSENRS